MGLDVDICRAMAAAIFADPDKVKYIDAVTVREFKQSNELDVVSRRLTWSLPREGALDLLFGPIMFYDGQGFLVAAKSPYKRLEQLSGAKICLLPGTLAEYNLEAYSRARHLAFKKVLLKSFDESEAGIAAGRCDALTADVTELGALRSAFSQPTSFDILKEQISKEPLAQLVRQGDDQFFSILRWTIFALIGAEELGITSRNVDAMLKSDDPDIRHFLGVIPGNGKALGLDERWAYNIVKTMGNYGELFERNVGRESAIKLDRGLNKLWTAGGLMFAPPLR